MELVKSVVNFELDKNGNAVAGNIERIYSVTDVSGTYQRSVRDVLSATDLASLLPDRGNLILQLQVANAEKKKAVEEMGEMGRARDEAIAIKDQALAEREAAIEARATAVFERDTVARERDELVAKYAPKMVDGFPVLTPVQMRRGLRSLGVSAAAVMSAIDKIPDEATRADALDQWEYALGFERANPLIAGIGFALGLTSEAIDAAWLAAA